MKLLYPAAICAFISIVNISCSSGSTASVPSSSTLSASSSTPIPVVSPDKQYLDNFTAGSKVGHQEGRDWGKERTSGLPTEFGLQHMANGWAENRSQGNKIAWKAGWIDGFKKGFASMRGGLGATGNPSFEKLSWDNVKVGAKLYENDEKLVATIVSADSESGLIHVKYRKSGSVEPKSVAALSNVWFVRKDQ